MSHPIEHSAERVGEDLSRQDMQSAAMQLRDEIHHHPDQALDIIHMANRIARDNRSPDHIVTEDPSGRVFIRDDYRHTELYVTNIYEEQRNQNRNEQQPGVNAGEAALLVLGGVILGKALGHHDEHRPGRDHGRR